MIVSVIIRREYELLLQKDEKTNTSCLPYAIISDTDDSVAAIVKKCQQLDFHIEPFNVYFEKESAGVKIICFEAHLLSYTNRINQSEILWVDGLSLETLTFVDYFQELMLSIIDDYRNFHQLTVEIERTIDNVSSAFQLNVEKRFSTSSFNVFVRSDYGNYCPFIFSIEYYTSPDQCIQYAVNWPLTRMFADGDKTDLYILFSSTMAILLKRLMQKSIYIDYLSLFDNREINASCIVFNKIGTNKTQSDFLEMIEKLYFDFVILLGIFERFIGSFSLLRNDSKFSPRFEEYLDDKESYNSFSREEHQFYANFGRGIFCLYINNKTYYYDSIIADHSWNMVDGVDGKILHQVDFQKDSYNFVSNEIWDNIQKLIHDQDFKRYTLVCQQNFLYVLSESEIWIINGDFSDFKANEETEKIYCRQAYESSILRFNRTFQWRYPISAGRFEELIADLFENEPLVRSVRLVGNVNNSDGGRDLLITKQKMNDDSNYITTLSIGQCKAYAKTVNKSHVRDLRDTLDYYGADGFFLAVSSKTSAQLIDHLCKLRDKYDVDWWTEREIFKKLRQHPKIADDYQDIIEIFENLADSFSAK